MKKRTKIISLILLISILMFFIGVTGVILSALKIINNLEILFSTLMIIGGVIFGAVMIILLYLFIKQKEKEIK